MKVVYGGCHDLVSGEVPMFFTRIWWHKPVIPALEGLSQEDCKFKVDQQELLDRTLEKIFKIQLRLFN